MALLSGGDFLPGPRHMQCATLSLPEIQPSTTHWVVGSVLSHWVSTGRPSYQDGRQAGPTDWACTPWDGWDVSTALLGLGVSELWLILPSFLKDISREAGLRFPNILLLPLLRWVPPHPACVLDVLRKGLDDNFISHVVTESDHGSSGAQGFILCHAQCLC